MVKYTIDKNGLMKSVTQNDKRKEKEYEKKGK